LFDTMISAQLLGYGAIGLAALAERHFDVKLPKDEQRSDWSMRPLRKSQLAYGAADVAYLIPLSEKLERELENNSRLEWAREEFALLTQREWPEREFDNLGYLKIKGARKLDSAALAVLRELYLVRDKRARDLDRPPFKVLGNRTLLELSQTRPEQLDGLANIKGITELIIRRFGRDILAAIKRGEKREHGPVPKATSATPRRRMDRRAERRVATLKRWRTQRSKELALDPGVLCPNSSLEAIAIAHPREVSDLAEIPELKDWFRSNFGPEIAALFADEGGKAS
jgi:ribonuclease D